MEYTVCTLWNVPIKHGRQTHKTVHEVKKWDYFIKSMYRLNPWKQQNKRLYVQFSFFYMMSLQELFFKNKTLTFYCTRTTKRMKCCNTHINKYQHSLTAPQQTSHFIRNKTHAARVLMNKTDVSVNLSNIE